MPRVARPGKTECEWKASPRTRREVRERLAVLAVTLGIPAEEILDSIVSPILGLKPYRNVTIPKRLRSPKAA